MTDDSGYPQTTQQPTAQPEPTPPSNGQQAIQLPSPTPVGQQQLRRHALKAAAAALQTRLGHLWQQPRTRSLGLIALVVAFGLSAILWYLKYYGEGFFPEYYIAAPFLVLIFFLGFLLPTLFQPRARELGLIALVVAFGLSAVLWYLKYYAGGVFPEYYIAAPFLALILLGLLTMAYTPGWSRWTGFGEYGPLALDHKRSKTLWDWLRLLIIPVMLGVGALWFNSNQDTISHQIAADQQQAVTLQTYLDRMSDLLLMRKLHESKPGDEVREVARVETLAALQQLDPERRGVLVRFLYEADLININTGHTVVSLSGAHLSDAKLSGADLHSADLDSADLSGADLSGADLDSADLSDAKLSGAHLSGAHLNSAILNGADLNSADLDSADLSGAKLSGADLSGAHLNSAILNGADLNSAVLRGANVTREQLAKTRSVHHAIMPDGSTHP